MCILLHAGCVFTFPALVVCQRCDQCRHHEVNKAEGVKSHCSRIDSLTVQDKELYKESIRRKHSMNARY